MLKYIDLTSVLFLDIETVSGHATFEELNPTMQYLWSLKTDMLQKKYADTETVPPSEYYEKAGIYSEFGKIVCISVGFFARDKDGLRFRVKSYFSHDEKELLVQFSELLNKRFPDTARQYLCGHNIKEFDIPYICRRMVIHGLEFPNMLDIAGKKPWETKHLLDTMEYWSFGDRKAFTSLKLLCGVFGIPTPKDDIDGSDVGRVYWKENDLERIETYCKKDVVATAQVFLKYKNMPILDEEQIIVV